MDQWLDFGLSFLLPTSESSKMKPCSFPRKPFTHKSFRTCRCCFFSVVKFKDSKTQRLVSSNNCFFIVVIIIRKEQHHLWLVAPHSCLVKEAKRLLDGTTIPQLKPFVKASYRSLIDRRHVKHWWDYSLWNLSDIVYTRLCRRYLDPPLKFVLEEFIISLRL